jgi:hypothetical protein
MKKLNKSFLWRFFSRKKAPPNPSAVPRHSGSVPPPPPPPRPVVSSPIIRLPPPEPLIPAPQPVDDPIDSVVGFDSDEDYNIVGYEFVRKLGYLRDANCG